jgi:hypothetical protein
MLTIPIVFIVDLDWISIELRRRLIRAKRAPALWMNAPSIVIVVVLAVQVPHLVDGVWNLTEDDWDLRRTFEFFFIAEDFQQEAKKFVHIPISKRRQAPLLAVRETAAPFLIELVLE